MLAALFVWLIALLFPFFDTINAIQGSIGYSFTAFVFPAGFYLWVYRSPQARANAPKQPRYMLFKELKCAKVLKFDSTMH